MYLTTYSIEQAVGHLLCHNLLDAAGHKAFKKGQRVAPSDLPRLRALGYHELHVAVLEPGDVHEDEAARRLGQALAGPGTCATTPVVGRVNLLAAQRGLLEIDVQALDVINAIDGLTVATLRRHQVVEERARLATIKVIPYAVPEAALHASQTASGVLRVLPLWSLNVGVVLVGQPQAEARLRAGAFEAIRRRVEGLGAVVYDARYVALEPSAIGQALLAQRDAGAELFILAGETSIVDRDDVIPQGIVAAGGHIVHYGAPVEPGNLLLLGELPGSNPAAPPLGVMGAPGCVRSRDANVVDLLLPRLLARQRLGKADIVSLGHGGLLL